LSVAELSIAKITIINSDWERLKKEKSCDVSLVTFLDEGIRIMSLK